MKLVLPIYEDLKTTLKQWQTNFYAFLEEYRNHSHTLASLGVGTEDSPEFTAINIGHPSDTTLARSGPGNLTVEGNAIYRAGGTDIPVSDGGTGASFATTARTNLGIGESDSPQFGTINIGHATDTTLGRLSAGRLRVELNEIYSAGGTDVPVTDGGTGASDAATARTNLGAAATSHTHAFSDITNFTDLSTFTPVWSASGSMTFDISPTVAWAKNQVIGGGLHFTLEAYSGTLGGTPSDTVYFTIPTGITSSSGGGVCALRDGDGAYTDGVWGSISSNRIYIMKTSRANFATGSYFGVDIGGLVGKS